ncbi:MAG TPA: hypothetical protein VFK16_10110 [Gemmatimonadaceae bacterium]|jgi:hypothetical protein|nr:hypothetical protein [Gemmatimonadaceae bacterium]
MMLLQMPMNGIPSNAVPIVAIVFTMVTAMVLGLPIVRAIIRRFERRAEPPAIPANLESRLDRIEQTVDSIAVEIERVAEAQRFLTRLQTETRSVGSGQPPTR